MEVGRYADAKLLLPHVSVTAEEREYGGRNRDVKIEGLDKKSEGNFFWVES